MLRLNALRSAFVRELLRLLHTYPFHRYGRINYRGLTLFIPQSVFNPTFSFSTDLLLDYIENIEIKGKVLELGCGSGAVSIYIALKFKAEVYCTDVNLFAIRATNINASLNRVGGKVKAVFPENLEHDISFDYAVTNPPYLPLEPKDEMDLNWCGGPSLEIVEKMLEEADSRLKRRGEIIFTLSSLSGRKPIKLLMQKGYELVGLKSRRTPFDLIYLYHFRKPLL